MHWRLVDPVHELVKVVDRGVPMNGTSLMLKILILE